MAFVLTLIANPKMPVLTGEHEAWAKDMLRMSGAEPVQCTWLANHIACDVSFTGADINVRMLEDQLDATFPDAPIDLAVQTATNRRKTLLVADMDSTLIEQECLDELADFAGIKDQVAAITERAMAGELSFEPALRERVGLLKGLEESALEQALEDRITLTPGGRTLVQTMKAHGAFTCLVSGGFTFFTSRVAEALGFDLNYGNTLLAENGTLTGQVGEPILGSDAKLNTLRRLINEHNIDPAHTMAVGDGANDLPMISHAGLGVAFRPHKILAEAADARIHYGDLTALLYLQGYDASQFVAT